MPEYVFDDPATHNFIRKGIERLREEFRGIFSHATIQRFVDEAIASLSGARMNDYVPLFANRFARERLQALAQVQGQWAKGVPEVLFVCVHNAGRLRVQGNTTLRITRSRSSPTEPSGCCWGSCSRCCARSSSARPRCALVRFPRMADVNTRSAWSVAVWTGSSHRLGHSSSVGRSLLQNCPDMRGCKLPRPVPSSPVVYNS
jgi:hypothetical protein